MADRYWIAATPGNWNDTANWSATSGGAGGASVPGVSDHARFDVGGAGNCTVDIAVSVLGLTINSTYTGVFDADDFDITIGTTGCTIKGTTTNSRLGGSGTWTCSGNWDDRQGSGINYETSTVKWTGSGRSHTSANGSVFYNLTVESGASYSGVWGISGNGTLTINGTLTVNSNALSWAGETVVVNGTLNGTSTTSSMARTDGTLTFSGTGTISCALRFGHSGNGLATIRFGATVPVFTDHVQFGNQTWPQITTVDCATNNPNLAFQCNVTIDPNAKGVTWTKGTGTIKLSGSGDQDVDFAGLAVEDIEIDKASGTVTLTGDVTTDSLTVTDGTLDIDANDTDCLGNCTVAAGTTVQDTTGGGLITVGGNFAINGTSGNEVTWNGPDLAITGTATADYATVTNSDASGGTQVTATNSTDGTGNVNWDFGSSNSVAPDEATHAHAAESPTITQAHQIAPVDAGHAHAAESPAISQVHIVAPVECLHSHIAESPTITQAGAIAPDEAAHSHTSESPTITQAHQIAPVDASHAHAAESPTVAHIHQIGPDDAEHSHTAESPIITQVHGISPADGLHLHFADSPTVGGEFQAYEDSRGVGRTFDARGVGRAFDARATAR